MSSLENLYDDMVKINIEGHELAFERGFVEAFEYEVCDSLEKCAKFYLMTDFQEKDLEKIFETHTELEICDVIVENAGMELALFRGEI